MIQGMRQRMPLLPGVCVNTVSRQSSSVYTIHVLLGTHICHKCREKGHLAKVCRSSSTPRKVTAVASAFSAGTSGYSSAMSASTTVPGCSTMYVCINDLSLQALVDSGNSVSFVSPAVVHQAEANDVPFLRTDCHGIYSSCVRSLRWTLKSKVSIMTGSSWPCSQISSLTSF